jgi:DNA-directed RNA polymerase delta subunit
MRISLVDAAYDYLKSVNSCIPFNELYSKAAEKAEIPEEQLKRKRSSFYSHLSLDSRFTQRENNTWDLTENHSYDETHIIVEEMDVDDDEEEEAEDAELNEGEDGESAENMDGNQTEEY